MALANDRDRHQYPVGPRYRLLDQPSRIDSLRCLGGRCSLPVLDLRLLPSIHLKAVGLAYALSDGIPIALVAVAGVLLFGNKLTLTNMVGIALLVVAVFMISSGG